MFTSGSRSKNVPSPCPTGRPAARGGARRARPARRRVRRAPGGVARVRRGRVCLGQRRSRGRRKKRARPRPRFDKFCIDRLFCSALFVRFCLPPSFVDARAHRPRILFQPSTVALAPRSALCRPCVRVGGCVSSRMGRTVGSDTRRRRRRAGRARARQRASRVASAAGRGLDTHDRAARRGPPQGRRARRAPGQQGRGARAQRRRARAQRPRARLA